MAAGMRTQPPRRSKAPASKAPASKAQASEAAPVGRAPPGADDASPSHRTTRAATAAPEAAGSITKKRPAKAPQARQLKAQPVAATPMPAKGEGLTPDRVDPIQATLLRHRYYRARARTLTVVALVLVALIVANGYLTHSLLTTPRQVRLFPVDEVGRRLNPPSLSFGHLDPQTELIPWVRQSLEMIYTYNYHHFQRQWNESLKRFTPEGRAGFEAQLVRDGRIPLIQRDQLVVRTRITGDILLCPFPETYTTRRDMPFNPDGVFEWILLAPYRTVSQETGAADASRLPVEKMFMVRVQRQPVLRSPLSVGIRLVVDFDRDLFGSDPCADLQSILADFR